MSEQMAVESVSLLAKTGQAARKIWLVGLGVYGQVDKQDKRRGDKVDQWLDSGRGVHSRLLDRLEKTRSCLKDAFEPVESRIKNLLPLSSEDAMAIRKMTVQVEALTLAFKGLALEQTLNDTGSQPSSNKQEKSAKVKKSGAKSTTKARKAKTGAKKSRQTATKAGEQN